MVVAAVVVVVVVVVAAVVVVLAVVIDAVAVAVFCQTNSPHVPSPHSSSLYTYVSIDDLEVVREVVSFLSHLAVWQAPHMLTTELSEVLANVISLSGDTIRTHFLIYLITPLTHTLPYH